MPKHVLSCLFAVAFGLPAAAPSQSPIAVVHTEGLVHGFLVLRTLEGEALAEGEITQVPHGDRITSHLILRFKDGSINEETVVFSQSNYFRVVSHPLDAGKEKIITDRLKLPSDIANGMPLTLLKNIRPNVPQTAVSMVAATPKPRLVKLLISPEGEDSFSAGGTTHKATRYVIKVDIGGVAGVVAPLVGKQPQDIRVWILEGDAPVFVKSEGPLYQGGPIWRIELTSPVWPSH
jgi:hypothetical protein